VKTDIELVREARELVSNLRFREAADHLREAIALNPDSVTAFVELGRLALARQEPEEALEWLDRAMVLQPGCGEAIALQGVYWMQQRQFERAIELLGQAAAADPNLAMIYFNLGKSYCEVRQFEAAERNLRKAIELQPDHFEAYGQVGRVEIETGRLRAAADDLLKAVRINPHYVSGYLALGSLCVRAGKLQTAIRLYRTAIERNPGAFVLREVLCSLLSITGDFDTAFQEALELTKRRNFYTDYLRLGSFAVALQNFETAQQAFQTSLELNPTSWEGHYNLAEIYMSARMMEQAREHYQAALDKNINAYEPFNGMGLFALIVDQDYVQAIDLFRRAIEAAPTRPEPQLNMALAYAKNGELAGSRKYAAAVLSVVSPGDPIYEQAERLTGMMLIESRTLQTLR
jgi:superkiller protein 3